MAIEYVRKSEELQMEDMRTCLVCGREVPRSDMSFTTDCHGITYRLVCWDCWQDLMAEGYDGEYYSEEDENIEEDW